MITAIPNQLAVLSRLSTLQILLLEALLMLLACSFQKNPKERPSPEKSLSYTPIDNFNIPRLETTNEQLAFARTSLLFQPGLTGILD